MIDPYDFDNANANGDKEAVIVPNTPTLVNKLSANETNGIRDKLNELVDVANTIKPILYPELRLLFKGDGNTLPGLQIGDVVHGFADATTIWPKAIYEGGDVTDRSNYTPLFDGAASSVPVIIDGVVGVTAGFAIGQQTYVIPAGGVVTDVTLSHAKQYKVTLNNTTLVNRWSQSGNILTINKAPALNNYIYIEYISF